MDLIKGFGLHPDLTDCLCVPVLWYSGNTLKNIEKECCAKIMIRGKGSVKEGKVGRKDGQMLPGEDEPLHALVTANTMDNVKKAVEQVGYDLCDKALHRPCTRL